MGDGAYHPSQEQRARNRRVRSPVKTGNSAHEWSLRAMSLNIPSIVGLTKIVVSALVAGHLPND
jgi:hypothetical protein